MIKRVASSVVASALLAVAPVAAQQPIPGLDAAAMDTTVLPGNDFYRYANGNLGAQHQIPNDRSSFGAFNIAADLADAHVRTSCMEQRRRTPPRAPSCARSAISTPRTSTPRRSPRRGTAPIKPMLDTIAAIGDKAALARFIGAHLRADVDPINLGTLHTDNLFGLWVAQDFNRSDPQLAALLQGGLEMPDRSYYLDSSPKMAGVRDRIPRARRADADARRCCRRRRPGPTRSSRSRRKIAATHWKVRGQRGSGEGEQSLGARRLRAEGAWTRLGRVLRRCRARRSGFDRCVAAERDHRRRRRWSASEPLDSWKALACVSRDRGPRDRAAAGVRPRVVRVLRPDAERRPGAGHARQARHRRNERRARLRRRASSTSQHYFPASAKARAQAMVAGHHRRIPEAHRRARLDGAGDKGRGEGQARARCA